jgi:hypothetical protein
MATEEHAVVQPGEALFASCNGLLCFYKTYTLKIPNPATDQCMHISKPPLGWPTVHSTTAAANRSARRGSRGVTGHGKRFSNINAEAQSWAKLVCLKKEER